MAVPFPPESRSNAPVVLGVVSDTHMPRFGGVLPPALVRGLTDARVAAVVHCGDFTGSAVPALFEAVAPLVAVAGNNDPPELVARFGRKRILHVAGFRVGVVHGDAGRGRTTPDRARGAFAGERVDVVCFGHSHIPFCEATDGVLLLNPGSPTDKRRQARYSFAVLELGATASATIVFFDRDLRSRPASARAR